MFSSVFTGYLWNLDSRNSTSLTKRKLQFAVTHPYSLFQALCFKTLHSHCIPVILSVRQDSVGRGSWWSTLLYPFPLSYVNNEEAMHLLVDSLKTCHRQTPTSKYSFWGAAKSQVLCATPTPFLQCYTPISLPLCLSNSVAGLCASCRFGSHAEEDRILLRSSYYPVTPDLAEGWHW